MQDFFHQQYDWKFSIVFPSPPVASLRLHWTKIACLKLPGRREKKSEFPIATVSDQRPGYLLFVGDEILPSYIGIVLRHYVDTVIFTNQDFMVHVSQGVPF